MQREYREETKAAVLAALLQGQSMHAVARQYEIPRSTIQGWRDAAGLGDSAGPRPKKKRIGELLLKYLEANLETLAIQQEQFQDKEWLKEQGASELAVLHGVLTDKAIRLLESLSRSTGEDDDAAEE